MVEGDQGVTGFPAPVSAVLFFQGQILCCHITRYHIPHRQIARHPIPHRQIAQCHNLKSNRVQIVMEWRPRLKVH